MRVQRFHRGFTLIELMIAIVLITILAALSIPSLLASRKSANEADAISNIRAISSAETVYRFRNSVFADLSNLFVERTIDSALANATTAASAKSGYVFSVTVNAATAASQYFVTATPAAAGAGDRQFYSDEAAVIFTASAATSTPTTDSSGLAPPGFSQIGL